MPHIRALREHHLQLGGQEDVLSLDAGIGNPLADLVLVLSSPSAYKRQVYSVGPTW